MNFNEYDTIIATAINALHERAQSGYITVTIDKNDYIEKFSLKMADFCSTLLGDKVVLRMGFFPWVFNKNYRKFKRIDPSLKVEWTAREVIEDLGYNKSVFEEIWKAYYNG